MKTKFFSPSPLSLTIAFGAITIVIFILAVIYFSQKKETVKNDYARELSILTSYKLKNIENWRNERIGDANLIANNPEFIPHVKDYLDESKKTVTSRYIEDYLSLYYLHYDYYDVFLVDSSLNVLFSAGKKTPAIGRPTRGFIAESLKTGRTYFSNLYRSEIDTSKIFLNIIAPIIYKYNIIAYVVLRVNPENYLYPFIQTYAPNEETSETLMFCVEDDEVVALNEFRHLKNTALKLKFKINEENKDVVAVKTALGNYGVFEGVDYRHEKVLCDSRKIENTPWYLLSKIDEAELYRPIYDDMLHAGIAAAAVLLVFGLGIVWLWSNRKKTLQIVLLKEEAQRLALLKHFEHLVKYANDMIVLSDENMKIVEVNDRALETYGYKKEELSNITLRDFIVPESAAIPESMADGDSRLTDGIIYETIHRRKDGSVFPVEVSYRMLEVNGQKFSQRIIRDISDRKKAEEALKVSESKYHRLYESMIDGFVIVDMNGVCTEFNSAYSKMLGYTSDELKKLSYKDITPEKWHHLEEVILNEQFFEKGYSGVYEKEYRRKDGTVFPVEIRSYLLKDENGMNDGMWAIVRDITERKKAEEEVRISEEKFSKIFRLSTHAFALTDPEDGTVLEVNEGFTEVLGFKPGDIVGKRMTETGIWADPEDRIRLVEEIKKGIPARGVETRFRNKRGEDITGLYNAEIITVNGRRIMIGNFADITELKRSEEKFSNLFHFSPFAITLSDPDTSEFIDVNEGFTAVTGYKRDEVIGKKALELDLWVNPDEREYVRSELRQGRQVTGKEYRLRRRTGEIFTGYFFAGIITVDNRNIMFTSLSDISDLKEAEQEIVKLNQELEQRVAERTHQLEQANKELEAFSYSVSHDLRSPLRSIDGFSLALYEDYYKIIGDDGKDYIDRIRNAAKRMDELIDGMLKLSRVTRYDVKFENISLTMIAKEVTENMRVTNKDKKCRFLIQEDVNALCDQYLAHILLGNLFGNAWKYSSKKDEIAIEFGTLIKDGKTVYFVRDNGAGFDMKYYNKLFGAFQRLHTSKEYPGTGIGLATALRIVHRHNGEIWAEGKVDEGAAFFFTLN